LYENAEGFAILPTFYVLYGPVGCMNSTIVQDVFSSHTYIDPTQV